MDKTYRTIWYNFTLVTILWVALSHFEEIRAYFDVHPIPVMLDEMGFVEMEAYPSDIPSFASSSSLPEVIDPAYGFGAYTFSLPQGMQSFQYIDPIIANVCVDSDGQYTGHSFANSSSPRSLQKAVEEKITNLYIVPGIRNNEYIGGCVTITFVFR